MLSIILSLLQIKPELNLTLQLQNSKKADMWLLSHKHHYLLQTETHRPGDFAVAGQWGMACSSAGKSDWQKLGCLSATAVVSLYIYWEGLRCLQSLYSAKRLCMFQLLEGEKWYIIKQLKIFQSLIFQWSKFWDSYASTATTGKEHWNLMRLFPST